MTLSSNSHAQVPSVRRARPLLGTFVDIQAMGLPESCLAAAIDRAFGAVERVQQLMSFHDPRSDVSRLNRQAARRPVRVSAWTYQVLSAAKVYYAETDGAFDIAVAPLLEQWGFLPRWNRIEEERSCLGCTGDIEIRADQTVRFHRPLRIDLGGIAKGFAVDKAVEELRAGGVGTGVVNAGGDLRVFGVARQWVHIRHPARPGLVVPLRELNEAAIATSATYFSRRTCRNNRISPLVDTANRRAVTRGVSVTVQAPTCMVADALTKVVFARGGKAGALLRDFAASAFIMTRRGEIFSTIPADEA